MKKLGLTKRTLVIFMSTSFAVPLLLPQIGHAQFRPALASPDLFPIDNMPSTDGNKNNNNGGRQQGNNNGNNNNGNGGRNNNGNNGNNNGNNGGRNNNQGNQNGPWNNSSSPSSQMNTAQVPEAYACPLFENRPHEELLMAIDALSREVKVSQECSNQPSAQAIDQSTKTIRESISALKGFLGSTDASSLSVGQVESTVSAAISATQNLGEILNSNSFINSNCGRQTMSSGKALLAFNDILNGLSPYALLAVSMNAALTPALPWVVGGVAATSAISVMGKMIDQNTLDMNQPEHRKAVLANTCQFIKVAKKVRFMQLAQSGRIEKVTEELERNMQMYNARFSKPSAELSNLLTLKNSVEKNLQPMEQQLSEDRNAILDLEAQSFDNQDDAMTCLVSAELVRMAQAQQFPATVFNNLEAAARTSTRASKIQVASLRSLNSNSLKRVASLAEQAANQESAVKACANAGKSWLAGVKQAVKLTQNILLQEKELLEQRLSQSVEYRGWKAQFNRIKTEEVTIKRVEKAMAELAKDNSIIDRSELDQRMSLLKAGLFGRRSSWSFGKPPVLAWLEHTKSAHDRSMSAFIYSMQGLRVQAWGLAQNGRLTDKKTLPGQLAKQDQDVIRTLSTFNVRNLPMGSREHELICQQLETTWLDWSAAIDHLGATQFYCDMIDDVIDNKTDKDIALYCRGARVAYGVGYTKSAIQNAKDLLVNRGYKAGAETVAARMKDLRCPVPSANVME